MKIRPFTSSPLPPPQANRTNNGEGRSKIEPIENTPKNVQRTSQKVSSFFQSIANIFYNIFHPIEFIYKQKEISKARREMEDAENRLINVAKRLLFKEGEIRMLHAYAKGEQNVPESDYDALATEADPRGDGFQYVGNFVEKSIMYYKKVYGDKPWSEAVQDQVRAHLETHVFSRLDQAIDATKIDNRKVIKEKILAKSATKYDTSIEICSYKDVHDRIEQTYTLEKLLRGINNLAGSFNERYVNPSKEQWKARITEEILL